MNLMYLAQSGLVSAQSSLHVVGNNLSNAMTPGYSRQSVVLGEAGGRNAGNGFFGYGSQVNGVQRAYDGFINNQVRSAATEYAAMSSRYEQLSQIDNMLGDDTANISVSLGNMFGAMEKISQDPVSLAARQETLSNMRSISYQFQTNSKTLNGLEKSTNTQINQSVDEINACAEQLAKLNKEIAKIHGQTGTLPADLMDQRDRLLDNLSQQVGIRVNENPVTGRVDVTMANGLPLVNGDRAYALQTSPSPADPSQVVVSYVDASGNAIPIDESKFTAGKLGGLFKFRNEDLVDARNQLNELALQMANRFNEVNREGYDAFGNPGGDLFYIADPVALANRNNAGSGSLEVSYDNISQVTPRDYNITYTDTGWQVTTRDGTPVPTETGPNGELQFDGLSIMPQGVPQPGDSFQLNSVSGVADNLSVAISDGNEIAASSSPNPDEQSNNENILALIAIKNETLIGKSTLDEAYAALVSSVGSSMTSLKASASTSIKAYEATLYQKQAVSGVDLNEEFVNLQMFSQYYQANAQVLQTATTLFDTILSIR
ncbi:Flagellar hook-associated protein 1 [Enterobacter cancerogenus]|uniref:flagellar hook-associated protein FlgK n=1 Tax=Enterobacter cancerogenus TaxID=69218 RepID=UPI001928BC3E|nr:flagellar hook-associated protein FlgK [Enterobacter cancerogenus]CAD5358467.1 Flagellar hook-associated protein 1 [Enterobacter cancerogenus]